MTVPDVRLLRRGDQYHCEGCLRPWPGPHGQVRALRVAEHLLAAPGRLGAVAAALAELRLRGLFATCMSGTVDVERPSYDVGELSTAWSHEAFAVLVHGDLAVLVLVLVAVVPDRVTGAQIRLTSGPHRATVSSFYGRNDGTPRQLAQRWVSHAVVEFAKHEAREALVDGDGRGVDDPH